MAQNDRSWHLDKRVNVSIILVLAVQIVSFVWLLAAMNADINANKREIVRIDAAVNGVAVSSNRQAIQLGRIEEQITGLRADFQRLFSVIERRVQ